MKVYTKTGDKGTTSLVGGERVGKDDLRVIAYGTVDELTAMLAYLRDSMAASKPSLEQYREDLLTILGKLMTVEALIATGENSDKKTADILDSDINWIESRIDDIGFTLRPLTNFTLPGGHPFISWAHVCRTICRRAERTAVKASRDYKVSPNAIIYLNRLSDYLYQLGRKLAEELGIEEIYWNPAK